MKSESNLEPAYQETLSHCNADPNGAGNKIPAEERIRNWLEKGLRTGVIKALPLVFKIC